MTSSNLSVVILAAGKGTRMKSQKAKVLHEVFFHPMIHHVVRATEPLSPRRTVVIVGHQAAKVQTALTGHDLEFALQEQQLGTGHAVLSAAHLIPESENAAVMILCGDTPLIRSETLHAMYLQHQERACDLTLMTTRLEDPTNYGRILKDENGKILGIVEQKDATEEQRQIREINAGIYIVEAKFLFTALQKVGTDNSQGEMYLTDIVSLAVHDKMKVESFIAADPTEILGVNSRVELASASRILQMRRNVELMSSGISMSLPETTIVSSDSKIGQDTFLESLVRIEGASVIGSSCAIGQGTILHNTVVGDNVTIGPYSFISGSNLVSGTVLPPYSSFSADS